jgi:hypothetical protein
MNSDPKYLITFDVEEWWSVHSFSNYFINNPTEKHEDRIVSNIDKILFLLKKIQYTCYFFYIGKGSRKVS